MRSLPTAFVGLLVVAMSVVLARSERATRETGPDLHEVDYVGSAECRRCHPMHAESFISTFHRTMTQDARRQGAVLGPFDGRTLRYAGHEASFVREGEDYVVRIEAEGEAPRRYVVERTVGSHRYQQYLAREGDTFVRLPVGFHVAEQRFFHMNEAFLLPDPPGADGEGPIATADYDRHVTRWNDNCVFCHNVAPNPGLDEALGTFDTEVAELGVACEACHGPGREHVARNADPIRRYVLHLSSRPDPTIVNPERLLPERSADACGRCHGQRITDDVGAFLAHGDPFVPGDDLALYSAPLFIDTTLHGEEVFGARFWSDGTPRLTAYEYQGLLESRCASEGELTCTTCHGMHEGEPAGQIRPAQLGDAMCTGCHLSAERTPHPRDAPHASVDCASCHMPEVVFGLRSVHVSHRIDVPRPLTVAPGARPDACVLCHAELDETRARVEPEEGALFSLLLGGDPIQRSVAATALGGAVRGVSPEDARGWLLTVMADDPYPAVRAIAWSSLRTREHLEDVTAFGPTDSASLRAQEVGALLQLLPHRLPTIERVRELGMRRSAAAIDIGE
jgi:predicted CXXCH cytochrome family protein